MNMSTTYIIEKAEDAFEMAIDFCESRKDWWFAKWCEAKKKNNTILMNTCESQMQLLNKRCNEYRNILIEIYGRTEYDYENEREYEYDDEYEEFDEN